MNNAYDEYGPKLRSNGMDAHPIGPGTKWPQVRVNGEYENMSAWEQVGRSPAPSPQPGAGVGIRLGRQRCGRWLIALDWDNDKVSDIALGKLASPVSKVGARGHTGFFVSDKPIPSKDFKVGKKSIVQVLSDGKQTVLPPSIHPDTGGEYFWLDDFSLMDPKILERLPKLPPNYLEIIEEIIGDADLVADAEESKPEPPTEGYDQDSPFAILNTAAMRDLEKWVPDLNLYKCQRKPGRYASYEAVATWRPSANALEARKPNLKISGSKGIKDFGADQGYSPIDLVMAAKAVDRAAAFDWLAERVLPKTDIEVDFDKIIENAESPSIEPEDDDPDDDNPGGGEAPKDERKRSDFSLLGVVWRYGDVLPQRPSMLVKNLIPATGYGSVAGQWGTLKTFVVNGLAAAIAGRCATFAGQEILKHGAVLMVELEGSNSEARVTAAAQAADVDGPLPIALLSQDPPKILLNGALNPKFKAWCNQLADYGKSLARDYDVPLVLITIDPQNRVAGFRDEQSSAENQVVGDAWTYLANKAGCTVIVVDHFGKQQESGMRGSSVKEANAHFVLNTSARSKDVFAPRYLEIRKQRNGISGVCVDFRAEEYFVTMQQHNADGEVVDVEVSTLVLNWEGSLHPVEDEAGAADDKPKTQSEQCMDELRKGLGDSIIRVASGDAPGGYGLRTVDWQTAAESIGIDARRFSQIKSRLKAEGRIGENVEERIVWIALPSAT
jgi:hypothetical protein